MTGTNKSQRLFSIALACPWLFRPLVTGILQLYPYRKGPPHWTLLELKDQLGIRVSRRMKVDGLIIEADPFDGPGHTFWRLGLTEPETRSLLAKHLQPGQVMLDIGAYVGQFSLVASQLVPNLRVFAFEPTPSVFAQLQRNIELNDCRNVTCVNLALSDTPGTAQFFTYPGSADQNSLRPLSVDSNASIEVRVGTVDSFLKDQNLDRLDVLKIDVEGNELAVLKGAGASLSRFKPVLIVEISRHQRSYGYTGADIKSILNELLLDCFRISDQGLQPYEPVDSEIHAGCSHFNIVALPRESAAGPGIAA
jgi:FkbM family methyltransferase